MAWGGAGVRPPDRVYHSAERAANAFIGRWEELRCLYNSMDSIFGHEGLGNRSL